MQKTNWAVVLLTLMFGGDLSAEVFQWTDARGVIHFTDNIYSVPEPIRGSRQLIIRRDFDRKEKTVDMSKNSEEVVSEASPEVPSDQGSQPSTPISREPSPSVTFEGPQPINIIIVNIHRLHPGKKLCLPPHGCAGGFKPNFNDRRFIHPSVFDGSSSLFNQPRLFSRPRTRK